MKVPAVFLCLFLPFVFTACGRENPGIRRVEVRRLFVRGTDGGWAERLGVFLLFRGGNGAEDFASAEVEHCASGIRWTFPASAARHFAAGEEFAWTGCTALAPVPFAAAGTSAGREFAAAPGRNSAETRKAGFPPGDYTVRAWDFAGSEALSSFVLDAGSPPLKEPVLFSVSGSGSQARWQAVLAADPPPGAFPRIFVFLTDAAGTPLSFVRLEESLFRGGKAEGTLADFTGGEGHGQAPDAEIRALRVYTETGSCGILSLPLPFGYDGADGQ